MEEIIIKTFERDNKYYMVLKDPKRTEIEISYVEYVDITNTNSRIETKYKLHKQLA